MAQRSLRRQETVAEELAPLPSSWQHSVSDKDVAKPQAYSTLRMATLEYSVLHCDVPSVDQLHSLQVRVCAGPSCHHLSLSGSRRTPNVKG